MSTPEHDQLRVMPPAHKPAPEVARDPEPLALADTHPQAHPHRRVALGVLHLLALGALFVSVWSGSRLAIDERPLFAPFSSLMPAMAAPLFWHHISAAAWLGVALTWIALQLRRRPAPVDFRGLQLTGHAGSVLALQYLLAILFVSGSYLLLEIPRLAALMRDLHIAAALCLLLALADHLVQQWRMGRWRRLMMLWRPARLRMWASALVLPLLSFLLLLTSLHAWQGAQVYRVRKTDQPQDIDGLDAEGFWRDSPTATIDGWYGHFKREPQSVSVKVAHDGYSLLLFLRWPDPTASLDHLPLRKTPQGWKIDPATGAFLDETALYEDKLAILVGGNRWDALRSVFLGGADGRGGHFAPGQDLLDVWHWKAVRNHGFLSLDDSHFGALRPPQPGQLRYTWGYGSDPLLAGGSRENWTAPGEGLAPLRLPRSPTSEPTAQGMTWTESQPWQAALDSYPIGSRLPSVIWVHHNEGDRADVRAAAQWKDGHWHLELSRPLSTGSSWDRTIGSGSALWFAVFDHARTRHSIHWRPLILELENTP